MSVIDDYKLRELMWPCVMNESIGSAIELRDGSRDVVREIERIGCSSGNFIKEWTDQPIIKKVRELVSCIMVQFAHPTISTTCVIRLIIESQLDHKESVNIPPFNWTMGYKKFRQVMKKLDDLIKHSKEVVLAENPNMKKYIETVADEADKIIDERLPATKSDWK